MNIAVDKVAAFIDRVRMFDVKEGVTDPDSGSNGVDDGMTDVLIENEDDPTEQELKSFIVGLNEEERAALVALVWVGRGDYDPQEWNEALHAAMARSGPSTARYLLGIPNVGDLADEGLAAMTEAQDLPSARDPQPMREAPRGAHSELAEEVSEAPPEGREDL